MHGTPMEIIWIRIATECGCMHKQARLADQDIFLDIPIQVLRVQLRPRQRACRQEA